MSKYIIKRLQPSSSKKCNFVENTGLREVPIYHRVSPAPQKPRKVQSKQYYTTVLYYQKDILMWVLLRQQKGIQQPPNPSTVRKHSSLYILDILNITFGAALNINNRVKVVKCSLTKRENAYRVNLLSTPLRRNGFARQWLDKQSTLCR